MPKSASIGYKPGFQPAPRAVLLAWIETLEAEKRALEAENRKLKGRVAHLEEENARLKQELETAQRAGKRQAAPFAKGAPKSRPKRAGRKRGHAGAHRPTPAPTEIDFTYEAALPSACPECGGSIYEESIAAQYQIDIPPVKPVTTQFNVHLGHCTACGAHLQGHHPLQLSDALGAANITLGPRALALAAEAKHDLGIPYTKIVRFFEVAFGLRVCRATFARADQRLAQAYLLVYAQLILVIRQAAVVWVDETGWRVGGQRAWLWVFTTATITLYVIDPSRAHHVPENVLGPDFDGFLTCDGGKAYDALDDYAQQKCLRHLLNNAKAIFTAKSGPAAEFSRQAATLFSGAIRLHQRRQAGQISERGYAIARTRLEQAFDRLLDRRLSDPDNRHFAERLRKHRHQLFAFLYHDSLEPTNNRAEREIRPAVVIRKTSACNRAPTGAHVHEVLASILRTCRKHDQSFLQLTLWRLLHPLAPLPEWLDLILHPPLAQPAMGSP